MPFFRSLFAAVMSHWLVSEFLRVLVFDSQWTVMLTAAWLLYGYWRLFGRIPEAPSMRDAARAMLLAWAWPALPRMRG